MGHFLLNARRILISYQIHLKSQHSVARATDGFFGGVFRFALAVILFQMLSILWQNDFFLEKMGFQKRTSRFKTVLMSK